MYPLHFAHTLLGMQLPFWEALPNIYYRDVAELAEWEVSVRR